MAELYQTAGLFSRRNAAIAIVIANIEQKRVKKRRLWRRKWLARREKASVFYTLVQELALEDEEGYRSFMRVNRSQFYDLLDQIEQSITKQDTYMRKAVTAEERLAITLRHLATGESQSSLAFQFRVSQNLISLIVPEVCSAIYSALQPKYLLVPDKEEEWKIIARDFYSLWQFPNCLGALDGKRVLIEKPAKSGSEFYDYKGHFSVIMMALVDSDYKFIYLDVGTNGRASDAGVWNKCTLYHALESSVLNIPAPSKLPLSETEAPYVVVGDDAFPLKTYLLKPHPGQDLSDNKRIFNYRLSRARRLSENAFGVIASRFQIYRQPIRSSPLSVNKIVQATVVLHNYLRKNSKHSYAPVCLLDREDPSHGTLILGQWRQHEHGALMNLQPVPRKASNDAIKVRETFTTYFNTDGQVPWQRDISFLH